MPFPSWKAGSKVFSAKLAQQQVNVIRPAATQSRASVTAVGDDNELRFSLEENGIYVVEIGAVFSVGNTTPDVKTQWTVPAGATGIRQCVGATSVAASATNDNDTKAQFAARAFTTDNPYQLFSTNSTFFFENAVVVNGAQRGEVIFRWAQVTSSATSIIRQAESFMRVTRYA